LDFNPILQKKVLGKAQHFFVNNQHYSGRTNTPFFGLLLSHGSTTLAHMIHVNIADAGIVTYSIVLLLILVPRPNSLIVLNSLMITTILPNSFFLPSLQEKAHVSSGDSGLGESTCWPSSLQTKRLGGEGVMGQLEINSYLKHIMQF
jgi:hypothetical protein